MTLAVILRVIFTNMMSTCRIDLVFVV
jgi:hypothetical protein